jgi:hypothetical protein
VFCGAYWFVFECELLGHNANFARDLGERLIVGQWSGVCGSAVIQFGAQNGTQLSQSKRPLFLTICDHGRRAFLVYSSCQSRLACQLPGSPFFQQWRLDAPFSIKAGKRRLV